MKQMERQLPAGQFVRVHKSYLANLASVERLSGNVLLVGQRELPVALTARRYCVTCGSRAAHIPYCKRLAA